MDFDSWTDEDLEVEIHNGFGGSARWLYIEELKRREAQTEINRQLREMEAGTDNGLQSSDGDAVIHRASTGQSFRMSSPLAMSARERRTMAGL